MRPVSAAFLSTLRESHQIGTAIDVLRGGAVIKSVMTMMDGTVTLDGGAATRGRVDATIVDDGTLGIAPLVPSDPLAPYGNEIRIRRGIVYSPAGVVSPGPGLMSYPGFYPNPESEIEQELVSLGVFRIDQATVTDSIGGLVIQITGQDRSARVIDARFEGPYQVASGTNYADAILAVLLIAIPELVYDFATTSYTTPVLVAQEGEDRWKFAQDMAAAIGMTLYFDGDGKCILRPVTSTTTQVVAEYAEGERGLLIDINRAWSRQGTFNRLIVTGENTSETAPARGVATDLTPGSPTYYYGQFGACPAFYSTPFVTTDAQAADVAAAMLSKQIGTTQQINFTGIVNPALEPDDVLMIGRERAGINEAHILDQVTIPLSATGSMGCSTRATLVTG